ncbi:MAG: biopolymer transporter ExbD [Prevotellaceae bacterium]|jgi:biopolymer transport protein ExbD|nr:biopolymer transporter ExbD [Prevotellaceae bacterium]
MAIRTKVNVDPSFPLSSMTDLVFLLLIFFMISSTMINSNALKLLLPKSTNQVSTKPEAVVSIKHLLPSNTFLYYVNSTKHSVAFSDIERKLQEHLADSDEPVVSIYVDKTAPVAVVVDVMNIAKRNKYKVLLATSPE